MRDFLSLVRQASAAIVARPPTAAEQRNMEMGRVLASQLLDALRSGEQIFDALPCAAALITHTNADMARGFFQEIDENLAGVPRGGEDL